MAFCAGLKPSEENNIDNNNYLMLDSKDLNTPLKSGITCCYGYKSIEDCIY